MMCPLTETLFSVPLLAVNASDCAVAELSWPPVTVPPSRFQGPVAPFSVSVLEALLSVPVRFTVPPVRVKPGKLNDDVAKFPPSVKVVLLMFSAPGLLHVPLRPTVELAALIVPPAALLQAVPFRFSVPLVICTVPPFVNDEPPTLSVRAVTPQRLA